MSARGYQSRQAVRAALLDVLREARDSGEPLPRNPVLCDITGYADPDAVNKGLRLLERQGRVVIERRPPGNHYARRFVRWVEETSR